MHLENTSHSFSLQVFTYTLRIVTILAPNIKKTISNNLYIGISGEKGAVGP
jgi:hypothetical protein